MNENDIRDLIYDAIQDGCIDKNHEELKYAIHFSLIGPDPSTNRTEARFYIDDVRGWESVFFDMQTDIDTPGFYLDVRNVVHLLVQDYLALPHNKGCYIQNGRANGKTASFKESERMAREILADLSGLPANSDIQKHAQAIIWGKLPITNNMNEKGKSTMAMTEGIKITTDRYVSESEAYYDSELKKIETKLAQDISNAQFEAQKARCDLENWFRAERIKEQESDKALKRKAYYDGLIASGFTEDQALKILLEDL